MLQFIAIEQVDLASQRALLLMTRFEHWEIFLTDDKQVPLFLPSDIRQPILGSHDFGKVSDEVNTEIGHLDILRTRE